MSYNVLENYIHTPLDLKLFNVLYNFDEENILELENKEKQKFIDMENKEEYQEELKRLKIEKGKIKNHLTINVKKSKLINFKHFILSICYLDSEFIAIGFSNGFIDIMNLKDLKIAVSKNTGYNEVKSIKKIMIEMKNFVISISSNAISLWNFTKLSETDIKLSLISKIETSNIELLIIHSPNLNNHFVSYDSISLKLWNLENINLIEDNEKKIYKNYSNFVSKERVFSGKVVCFHSCMLGVNNCLLIGLDDGSIISNNFELLTEIQKYIGHLNEVTCISNILSAYFISSSKDKTLRIWHYKQNQSIYKILCSEYPISFVFPLKKLFNDDKLILIGNTGCEMKILNIDNNSTSKQYSNEYYLVNYEYFTSNNYNFAVIEGDFHLRLIKFAQEKN